MKIDVTKIEGYEEMSPEDKLKALESFDIEVPEPDYTGYVRKDIYDKTASELSEKKKELREKMTEDEAAKQAEQEERETLQANYDALLHKVTVSENKAKLLGIGYEESLASKAAEAMAKGDLDSVMKYQKQHLDAFEKKIRGEVLKGTPKPTGDGESKSMTLEKLRSMAPGERLRYSQENPDEYKHLYSGGND